MLFKPILYLTSFNDFFSIILISGFGYSLAVISSGFSFFAMGGLVSVLTTVFFVMSDVTLFLKYDSRTSITEFILSTPRCMHSYVPYRVKVVLRLLGH